MDCGGGRKGASCPTMWACIIVPFVGEARGCAFLSLVPHKREGAERRLALLHSLAPRRRCRVPLRGTPPPGAPLWRLPPRDRLVGSGPGTFIPVIRAAFAALHPDRTSLLAKAALRSKGGREPGATRTSCARTQGRGRHACSVNQDAPRRRPH